MEQLGKIEVNRCKKFNILKCSRLGDVGRDRVEYVDEHEEDGDEQSHPPGNDVCKIQMMSHEFGHAFGGGIQSTEVAQKDRP